MLEPHVSRRVFEFLQLRSRCLAQVKSTYCFPQIWGSSCCLYVMNGAKSKTPTALGTVKHACRNHIHVSRCVFEFLQVLFPLPHTSTEHILFPADLGQFLVYVMNDAKSKNPIALGTVKHACWNHTSHVACLNFCKCCSRCLAQIKSTDCFPHADLGC